MVFLRIRRDLSYSPQANLANRVINSNGTHYYREFKRQRSEESTKMNYRLTVYIVLITVCDREVSFYLE